MNRNGELFARFWSRNKEIDEMSITIKGISPDSIAKREPDSCYMDSWIPKLVRDEYESWVIG
jgi:hypothetical protein